MAQPARNYQQPDERASRLFELGLEERTLEEAVIRGLSERQTCTPFHPPSYPGTTQWAETHAAIRQLLAPAGWTPCDRRNYSRVISPNERIALTVATGDLHTAEVGLYEPATRYPKGPATRDAVETNQQLSLLPEMPSEDPDADEDATATQTWILLLATDEHDLSYELSLPAEQDSEGRVVSWAERIIFPAITISEIPGHDRDGEDDEDEGDSGDIDVPIERI
jgi:hypothetical protein